MRRVMSRAQYGPWTPSAIFSGVVMTRLLAFSLLLLVARGSLAQEPGAQIEIQLRDGTILHGELIEKNDDSIVLEHRILGRLEIARADLLSLRDQEDAHSDWRSDPDRNTVMLSPTPQTIGRGKRYFRNFELFILNFGIGVHERVDIVAGALFPVSNEFNMAALGTKLMLLDRNRHPVGLAVAGNVARLDDFNFGSVAAIAGVGDDRRSLNVSIHQTFRDDDDAALFFMVGGDLQAGPSWKVVAEYTSGLSALFSDDDDIDGFLNLGFRWFGASSSFTLTGIRPIGVDTDSFLAFPLAMYSHHF